MTMDRPPLVLQFCMFIKHVGDVQYSHNYAKHTTQNRMNQSRLIIPSFYVTVSIPEFIYSAA